MNVKRKFTAFAAAFLLLLFATPSSAALEFETDTEVRDATYNTEPTQSLEAGVPDGIPEEMLETEGETTRAQFLTMLVNLANPELDTVQSTSFPDVPENAYYALQVSWAKANGIINGTAAGVLEPDTPLTRNEAAVMAARLAKAMGCDAAPLSSRTLLACADAAQVPLYARRAVKWCMENGILTASEKGFGSRITDLLSGQSRRQPWCRPQNSTQRCKTESMRLQKSTVRSVCRLRTLRTAMYQIPLRMERRFAEYQP